MLLARLAAFFEADAKKVVALSTLSQLGLMFVSLYLGGPLICLFHLLIHALAKAGLFLLMGGLIHASFSQQDIRFFNNSLRENVITLRIVIRILRLSGGIFISGFFSKDFILFFEFFLLNRAFYFFLLVVIVTLTFGYCLKLFFLVFLKNTRKNNFRHNVRIFSLLPIVVLIILTLVAGFFLIKNFFLLKVFYSTETGIY